jgi:hypothetical protein
MSTAITRRQSRYYDWPEHSPCEHFAAAGYQHLMPAASAMYQWLPEFEDDMAAAKAAEQRAVLSLLIADFEPPPKRKKKTADEESAEKPIKFAGLWHDWPMTLPRLKVWAGNASLGTIIRARIEAINAAGDLDCDIMQWRQPIAGASGLDPRTCISALDAGFSLNEAGMKVQAFCAAELLAIVGLQVSPITRFARNEYGYLAGEKWFSFEVRKRPGQDYFRQFCMAREWRATRE